MCAIIFSANELTPEQQLGVDIQANMVADNFSLRGNHGKGKRYTGVLIYYFRGKEVPALICCSPKGVITSMLFSIMLECMESLDLFPCIPVVPRPFILLDRHEIRVQLTFIRYVNNTDHMWSVCIVFPNGTAYWQVGDSPEKNGSCKMATTKYKRELDIFKTRMEMNITIKKTDSVPIICRAWNKCFAHSDCGIRAIVRRVWGPLNRGLLFLTEILSTKVVVTVN